jgi:signal peptidase II
LRSENSSEALGYSLIIGGAVGNAIDRVLYGAVADYLDFHAFGYHWPAFNVTDSAIFMGVTLILLFFGKTAKSTT